MGSKISVFVIIIAMVVLAGTIGDASEMVGNSDKKDDSPRTYEEVEEDKAEPKGFLFENYPLDEDHYIGTVSEVDFSTNPLAKNFEEIITRSVGSVGVNYAGKYSIATWSCGVECQNSAIVNVIDGSIHTYGILSAYGLSFSRGSTLLIINPEENILSSNNVEGMVETDYYSLLKGDLLFEGKEINGEDVVEDCIQAIANARNKITNEVVEFDTPCTVPFGWELIP